ncbi:MAG: 2-amino-4-hydroxy-6-hydroxymethyldihydropteridine diphosphokinase [Candidatus Acidiferrum sp.]
MNKIYLSLGSNIGDRQANLRAALAALESAGVHIIRVSSFYETAPVDLLEQPWFLNCAAEGETKVPPLALIKKLRQIETAMGSSKPVPRGPRLIDIDILLYGRETIATPELQIPHPRMHLRRFVLVPLAEIASPLKHPSWNDSVGGLLAKSSDTSIVRLFAP